MPNRRNVRELPDFTVRYNALIEANTEVTKQGPSAYSQRGLQRRLREVGWEVSLGQLAALATGKTRSPGGALLLAISQALDISPLAWFNHDVYQDELAKLRYRRDQSRGMELGTEAPSPTDPPGRL